MAQSGTFQDECFILVKALPHRSSKYFETVCCAGVGRDAKWRRQYPVPFRILRDWQKFRRWDWISYKFIKSPDDRRAESQKVVPESLIVGGSIKRTERARLLNPLIRDSFDEANSRGESLTLLRPMSIQLDSKEKPPEQLASERQRHADLANQASFLDEQAKPLEPCPLKFRIKWKDERGKERNHICDDWETSTAFSRFEREYGRAKAIEFLKAKYEDEYFSAGLVLAFSTHSRRNVTFGTDNQWLLVGLIRLDEDKQGDLLIG